MTIKAGPAYDLGIDPCVRANRGSRYHSRAGSVPLNRGRLQHLHTFDQLFREGCGGDGQAPAAQLTEREFRPRYVAIIDRAADQAGLVVSGGRRFRSGTRPRCSVDQLNPVSICGEKSPKNSSEFSDRLPSLQKCLKGLQAICRRLEEWSQGLKPCPSSFREAVVSDCQKQNEPWDRQKDSHARAEEGSVVAGRQ